MSNVSKIVPDDISKILGDPPLLIGENHELYRELFQRLAEPIAPADMVEWLLLKEIADYAWEALRLQRFKGAVVDLARKRAIGDVMRKLLDRNSPEYARQVDRLSQGFFLDTSIQSEVSKVLATFGLKFESINAQAFSDCAEKIQVINDLLGAAAARRDTAMREIQRRREDVILPSARHHGIVVDIDPADVSSSTDGSGAQKRTPRHRKTPTKMARVSTSKNNAPPPTLSS